MTPAVVSVAASGRRSTSVVVSVVVAVVVRSVAVSKRP
jgi:hypothetical protein